MGSFVCSTILEDALNVTGIVALLAANDFWTAQSIIQRNSKGATAVKVCLQQPSTVWWQFSK